MLFLSIAVKTAIPATAPAATSGAVTFTSIEPENWLQITGEASAGAGPLYLLRWNETLSEWRVYMEDRPIVVDSTALGGLFSAAYPFPKGEESFCLYDPAAVITATASAAQTGSPLTAPSSGPLTDAQLRASSVPVQIKGLQQNGATVKPVGVDNFGNLGVALADPLTAFNELLVAEPLPRVQIDAAYGLLTTDVETRTSLSGAATAANSLFDVQTGTTAGAYAVVRSRRVVRYRPGQGCAIAITARFTTGVAQSLQLAGAFTATDGLFVGYNGTSFGYMRRIPGAIAIWRLTVTTGATGAETITVRLAGTNFTVAAAGALSTTATAQLIAARVGGYTGWTSSVSPTSNGATVTFLQEVAAATTGTFTLTSTGGAVGTFAEIQAGAPNDNSTGFVAQTAWNVDRLDGSGGANNPSGMLLDPAKLNVYQIVYPYLGAGTIVLRVMTPDRRWTTVHVDQYPNAHNVPSMRNPSLRVGWVAASLGSTTNLTVQGASAAGFVQGRYVSLRDPVGVSGVFTGVSGTENAWILLRNRAEFGGVVNQRQLLPLISNLTVETAARIVRARYVLNPTLSATVNWQYVNQSTSSVEYATPTGITISGGTQVGAFAAATNQTLPLDTLDLRLEPGDVLAVALQTVSSTATADVSLNWHEE